MPAFTLKLGNQDLSSYLRVSPGEGFDPYDADGFLEPAFGDSPLAEGQPLTNVDPKTRTLAWPLHLSAANKDTLHALVRTINNEIATNPLLRVEWKDRNATNSTFYDVAFARFDPDFNYRRSEHNYASGTLRVWCSPPYGHTATQYQAGLTAASMLAAQQVTATPVGGDAPALTKVVVQTGSYSDALGRIAGVAALPHPSYVADFAAASITIEPAGVAASGALKGASGAAGSQYVGMLFEGIGGAGGGPVGPLKVPRAFSVTLPLGGAPYVGRRHRVLGVVSVTDTAGIAMTAVGPDGTIFGPTALATAARVSPNGRQLVDFGVLSVPSAIATAPKIIFAYERMTGADTNAMAAGASGFPDSIGYLSGIPSSGAMLADYRLKVDRIFVLPEDQLCLARDTVRVPVAADTFHAATMAALDARYDMLGGQWIASQIGSIGISTAAHSILAVQGIRATPSGFAAAATLRAQVNTTPRRDLTLNGQAVFAQFPVQIMEAGLAIYPVVGSLSAPPNLTAVLGGAASQTATRPAYIAMRVGGALVACAMVNEGTAAIAANQTHIRVDQRGPVATAVFRVYVDNRAATSFVLSASHGTIDQGGVPGVIFSQPASGGWQQSISDFSAYTVAGSQGFAPRDEYCFDGICGDQVGRFDTASALKANLAANRTGRMPRHVPSQTSAWLGFSLPIEGGPANELMTVDVSVRERFSYGR